MRVEIERGDSDVARAEARGHLGMRNCARKDDALEPGGGAADRRQLRSVADEHRADVVASTRVQLADRMRQMNRPVPAAKRAGKYRDDLCRSRERHGPGRVRAGLPWVRARREG